MSKMNARRSLTIDIPQPNIQNYGRLQEEAEPASETPAPPVYRLRKQNSNESIRRQRPNSNEGIPINGCQRLASADSTQSLNSGNGTQRHSSQNSMDRGNLDGSGRFPRPVNWQMQREISEEVVQEQMRRAASIHLERVIGRNSTMFARYTSLPEQRGFRRSFDQAGSLDDIRLREGLRGEERMHVPLHPNSVAKTFWDVIVCLTTILTLIVDPISLAFQSHLDSDWYAVTDRIIMAVFVIDIFVNFLSGFTDHQDNIKVELEWGRVAENYLKGWFIVDFVAALPAEAFNTIPQISMLRGARLVQAGVHAIKVSKVAGFAQRFKLNVDINLPPFVWKLLFWSVGLLLWLHITACIQCWVWVEENDEDYLTIDLHPGQVFIAGEECLYQTECVARFYLRAFRSACGFMLGHGQYSGFRWKEEVMVVVCSLSGSVLYKSFMSMCIQLLMLMDSFRVKHYSASKRLDKYMGRHCFPTELRFRARKYLESAWDKLGGLDESQVLGVMSRGLRGTVRYECSAFLIRSVPFFAHAPDSFVHRVAQIIKTDVFGAGDHLMVAGEYGMEMYLIKEGEAEVLDADDNHVGVLGPRDFFGENALASTLLRTSSVRAMTEGIAFIIEKQDMKKIYQRFPDMHRALVEHTRSKFGSHADCTPPMTPKVLEVPQKSTWVGNQQPPSVKAMAEAFKLTRNRYAD